MHRLAPVIGSLVLLVASSSAAAQPSELWGRHGERWDPRGRLPDFSYAGYHAGRRRIPDVPVVIDVRDTGARGDGRADDTSAIQRAIDRAGEMGGGAVRIPAGTYRLTGQLRLRDSGVVLRGRGRNETILRFERSLSDLFGWDKAFANGNNGLIQAGRREDNFDNVARVAEPASRGDRVLVLERDAAERGVEPGTWIKLTMQSDDRSLWDHRHNDQNGSPHTPFCDEVNGELGYWIVRVIAVHGARIVLDQPLRTDVRPRWNATVQRATQPVEEIGVEDLRVEFERTPYPGHHAERGYNAIGFDEGLVVNGWIRNVRIRYADNGISLSKAKHVTVQNVKLDGARPSATASVGHHGTRGGIDCLYERLEFNADYVHEVTFNERTTGTVVSRLHGDVRISLDHHSRAQVENLVTELDARYDWASGGAACAPRAGARHTYWGFRRAMDPPGWGEIQTTVVGDLAPGVPERQTQNRQWYERLSSPSPENLYEAQLERRLAIERRDARFAPGPTGVRSAFREGDAHRWGVMEVGGDARYWLATSRHRPESPGQLGERALIATEPMAEATLVASARTLEGEPGPNADVAVVLGHAADDYYYARLHVDGDRSGIHRVLAGEHVRLASAHLPLEPGRWYVLGLSRAGEDLTMTVDGEVVARARDGALGPGLAGLGTSSTSALFDDVVLDGPAAAMPPEAAPEVPGVDETGDRSSADPPPAGDAGAPLPDVPPPAPTDAAAGCSLTGRGDGLPLAWLILALLVGAVRASTERTRNRARRHPSVGPRRDQSVALASCRPKVSTTSAPR